MSEIKIAFLRLFSIISISLCVFIIPNFLDFMEKQDDILKIGKQNPQIFYVEKDKIPSQNIKVDFNIPIPEDIKQEMITKQKEKERLEKERIAREEAEKAEKERQEQIKIVKEQEEKNKAIQVAKVSAITNRSEGKPRDNSGWITFTATAYCGCSKCCGKSTGRTASGTMATQGRTVAMPGNYSFGTKIEIQGMGTYVVEDRGGAIKGNRIDIYYSNHQAALSFGKRTVSLKVVE